MHRAATTEFEFIFKEALFRYDFNTRRFGDFSKPKTFV